MELYNENKTLKIVKEKGYLIFDDLEKSEARLVWNEEPKEIDDDTLNEMTKDYRGSEWCKESARYGNYVSIGKSVFGELIDDWEVVGSTKYGRKVVSKKFKVTRPLTMSEFYGSGIVD